MPAVGRRGLLRGASLLLLDTGDIRIGADDARDAAIRHPLDRPSTAEDPHPVAIAMTLAIFERVLRQLAGVLPGRFIDEAGHVVGVNARQPRIAGGIDLFVQADAAHLPPHRGEERRVILQVVIPDPLPSALEGEVPAPLAVGKGGLRPLLPIDVDRLHRQVPGLAGSLVDQRRRRGEHPDLAAALVEIAAFGAIAADLACRQRRGLFARLGRILRMDDLTNTEADDLVRGVAEKVAERPVGIE